LGGGFSGLNGCRGRADLGLEIGEPNSDVAGINPGASGFTALLPVGNQTGAFVRQQLQRRFGGGDLGGRRKEGAVAGAEPMIDFDEPVPELILLSKLILAFGGPVGRLPQLVTCDD